MINFMGFGRIYSTKGRTPELTIIKKEEVKMFLDKITPFLILKKNHALFLLKEYNFGRNNNLNFDIDKFHEYPKRKGKENFYSKDRKDQIEQIKLKLSRSTE